LEEKRQTVYKNVGLVFGYIGSLLTFSASLCFYLMPSWLYYHFILPISIPFGLIFLIGTTLIIKAPLPAGALLLTASFVCATLTILIPLTTLGVGLELLGATLFTAIGGISAIQAGRIQ
jgi:hypothetical protein